MDYAGAQIGALVELGALSQPMQGAVITSTAQIPAPVDFQFLGTGLNPRERSLLQALLRRKTGR